MLRGIKLIVFILSSALVFGGCSTVVSRSLVGEPPNDRIVDQEAAELFNGVWKVEASSNLSHDVLYVQYLGHGKLHIAQLTWGLYGKADYKREDAEAVLAHCGTPEEDRWQRKGTLTLSTEGKPLSWQPSYDISSGIINLRGDDGEFYFAYYVLAGKAPILMVWGPDLELFQGAIKEGKLKGTVEEGEYESHVTIDEPTASLCAFIKDHGTTNAFVVGSPYVIVYRRILSGSVPDQEYTPSQEDTTPKPELDHAPQ